MEYYARRGGISTNVIYCRQKAVTTELVSEQVHIYIPYYKHFMLIIHENVKINYEIIILLTINIYKCGFKQIDV